MERILSAELSVGTTPLFDPTPPTAPTNVGVTAYNNYRNGVYFGTANTDYTITVRSK